MYITHNMEYLRPTTQGSNFILTDFDYQDQYVTNKNIQVSLYDNPTATTTFTASSIVFATPKVSLTSGNNKSCGSAVLVNGVITVNNTRVTSNSLIYLTRGVVNASTTLGHLQITTITNATSFVITSVKPTVASGTETTDQSTVNWLIIN